MVRTETTENYLKAIFEIQKNDEPVSTSALARKLQVASATVTVMLKRLSEYKPMLVRYKSHHGVVLTPEGRKIALEVIRHHRLLELFLHNVLGYSWDEVHEEADKLEHYISETFEDRIAQLLGNPQFDPHGDPIPAKDGTLPKIDHIRLKDLQEGQRARVKRVRLEDSGFLQFLGESGIRPETEIRIDQVVPFDGTMVIQSLSEPDKPACPLGEKATEQIWVVALGD